MSVATGLRSVIRRRESVRPIGTRSRRRRGERGYVLAFTAIIMLPLLAITGMATDVGAWYDQGASLQKAADASALAGVVWLPDFAKAKQVALDTAEANGFSDSDPNITVQVQQLTRTDLKVEITNSDAPVFFSRFFLNTVTIRRNAIGTYVLPVPMGSPKNFFGTGVMAPAADRENMWAALNARCSPREQGDPFGSEYLNGWNGSAFFCPADPNPNYVDSPGDQYEYMIYAPPGRTQPLVVHLYHPSVSGTEPGGLSAGGTPWSTRFRIYAPDNTPFDDSDNPLATCTGSGETNPRTYSGAVSGTVSNWSGSTWSRFCTIPVSAPSGYYKLGVRNDDANTDARSNPNTYSVLASYNGNGVRCDQRTDALCPTVQGRDWMSIYASVTSTAASFFLADVGSEHAGKQLEITLFDPGEGGQTIEILDPNGNPVRMDYYTTDGVFSGNNVASIDVSGNSFPQSGRLSAYKFNDRYLVITVDLPNNYAATYGANTWWKVRYNFGGSNVNDRTTWSVRVIGDPVHLSD